MTNDITTFGGFDLAALRKGLENVRATAKNVGGTPFLRLQKDGSWVFGSDDAEIGNGARAIINPGAIKHGYSCWTDRKPGEGKNEMLGEQMVSAMSDKPLMHQLEQHVDEKTGRPCKWSEQHALDLRFISGEARGTQVAYKTTSVGGIRAVLGVIDKLVERLSAGEGKYLCPVVEMTSDSYKHATYGKIYTPVIEVVGWADASGELEGKASERLAAPQDDDEPELELDEGSRRRRRG